jgi:hypothetical protein
MKSLPAPNLDHETLFRTCAEQTQDADNRAVLLGMTARVVAAGAAYRAAAFQKRLDVVVPIAMNADERVLLSELYDRRMSHRSGSGRVAYDELRSSAPLCPYCSIGEVYELDHFLPKSAFRDLNVLPLNLVPICHPCNHIKLETAPVAEGKHFLHPYFDVLPNVRWLFATLAVASGGPVLSFRVELADQYGALARRLDYHFRELKLDRRFKTRAATVLVELEGEISDHLGILDADQMAQHFRELGLTSFNRHGNTLETAAYFAAAESDEYCSGGYRN